MSAYDFPKYQNICCTPQSQKCAASPHYQPENACIPEKWIALIINDLSAKTHENTGNKPEIKHKLYMTTNNNNVATPIQPKSCKSKNPEIVFQTNTNLQMHTTGKNE